MKIGVEKVSLFLVSLVMLGILSGADLGLPKGITLSYNGTFLRIGRDDPFHRYSENGDFWCRYKIVAAGDEIRRLGDFEFFKGTQRLFSMKSVPGSDLYISNNGFIAFMDMSRHFDRELTIHFYSKEGKHIMSKKFRGASLFGFSKSGNKFGVGSADGFELIDVSSNSIERFDKAFKFDISEDENLIALALPKRVRVYSGGKLIREFRTGFYYTRDLKLSSRYGFVAAVDKKNLRVYSIQSGEPIWSDYQRGGRSYRELLVIKDKIYAGIQYRDRSVSRGILKIYDYTGEMKTEKEVDRKEIEIFGDLRPPAKEMNLGYKQIQWPFAPFDSMRTVWNYYEQHMGTGNSSYLHQGLDIIVPENEPVYAVEGGVVKCVLTIGGYIYWRIAVAKEQKAELSEGWLYAHIVPGSIQVDVGDTVYVHDYLGDIVHWYEDWGHIHFVEIRDTGLVWQYDDNEWGIVYNPLLSLHPDTDEHPPVFENVFSGSKFAFCINETSHYLDPDSLYGNVDIITKIYDYVGDSQWQQPPLETYYWVKRLSDGNIVFPKTLGHRLNHSFDFYASDKYEPYATIIYKRDSRLSASSWMSKERNYYIILTNSNGDTTISLSEKSLAFSVGDYPDGDYRIFIEARDEYGNSTTDSMDVKFRDEITQKIRNLPKRIDLGQNHPNPFNNFTTISYSLPSSNLVRLKVYNILGRQVCTVVDEIQGPGRFTVSFDGTDLPSGLYFYRLSAGGVVKTKKMILIR